MPQERHEIQSPVLCDKRTVTQIHIWDVENEDFKSAMQPDKMSCKPAAPMT
jgi:hypothetical protein